MKKKDVIYVAGHKGLVGSAIFDLLKNKGFENIIVKDSNELDLRNQNDVNDFFSKNKIDYVFLAAAKVGGIAANNKYKADFIYDNLSIQSNVIHSSFVYKVKKLLFLGSSCIYPKDSIQPIKEDFLLNGTLEPTNEPYAIAKIAGIKMCDAYRYQYNCNFISVMPTNLYGLNDNFDLENCHVLPALIRKFHEAKLNSDKNVIVWGDGTPKREFMSVDDCAEACLFLMETYNDSGVINVGTGIDHSIGEIAEKIKNIFEYNGDIVFDRSKPNGMKRKLLDVSKINNLGWRSSVSLDLGLKYVCDNINQVLKS